MSQPPTLLGIRQHGPGSTRSVQRALEELQPGAILIEGPPDAQDLLILLHNETLWHILHIARVGHRSA